MSFGFNWFKSSAVISTPSNRISGEPDFTSNLFLSSLDVPLWRKVVAPRIFNEGTLFGSPPSILMFKPGTMPCKACPILATGLFSNASAPTEATEAVRFPFFCDWKPMTTTSSIILESSDRVTFILFWLPTVTSLVVYPTKENVSTLLFPGTDTLYLPSMSVMVPVPVPFTITVTPIIGSPLVSFTTPVICSCWSMPIAILWTAYTLCDNPADKKKKHRKNIKHWCLFQSLINVFTSFIMFKLKLTSQIYAY